MAGSKKIEKKLVERCGDCPKWSPNWCPIWAKHAEARSPACLYGSTVAERTPDGAKGGRGGKEK